jgi:hypothetical protein
MSVMEAIGIETIDHSNVELSDIEIFSTQNSCSSKFQQAQKKPKRVSFQEPLENFVYLPDFAGIKYKSKWDQKLSPSFSAKIWSSRTETGSEARPKNRTAKKKTSSQNKNIVLTTKIKLPPFPAPVLLQNLQMQRRQGDFAALARKTGTLTDDELWTATHLCIVHCPDLRVFFLQEAAKRLVSGVHSQAASLDLILQVLNQMAPMGRETGDFEFFLACKTLLSARIKAMDLRTAVRVLHTLVKIRNDVDVLDLVVQFQNRSREAGFKCKPWEKYCVKKLIRQLHQPF